jgi:hypothetical protein
LGWGVSWSPPTGRTSPPRPKAVEQGVSFAKEIGSKITAVTVTEPFHLLSVAPCQLEYTLMEYKKHAEAHARGPPGYSAMAE